MYLCTVNAPAEYFSYDTTDLVQASRVPDNPKMAFVFPTLVATG
jgi:hypothetical protein